MKVLEEQILTKQKIKDSKNTKKLRVRKKY